MDARGALGVAAVLLLTACSSAQPQPQPTATPPATTSASASAEGAAATAEPDPLDVAPLGVYEPAEPASHVPCLEDGFQHLAIAGEPRAAALVMGEGPVGIVLGHQSNAFVCQWAPEAQRLAAMGYAVILPNLQVDEALAAMLAAEQHLRAAGAEEVVLAGASLGGLLAIASAAIVDDPPAGVIAFAPPTAYRGWDTHDFAPHVEAPVLLEVGTGDADLPEQAAAIADLLPAPPQLLEIEAEEHGVPLLEHAEARAAFDAFLADVAPTG